MTTMGMSHSAGDNSIAKAAKQVLATEMIRDVQMSDRRYSWSAMRIGIREVQVGPSEGATTFVSWSSR